MSGRALSALVLAAVVLAGEVPATGPDPAELPAELRDTLPGGSRLGDAPELPRASVDVLPRPTQVRIQVRRRALPAEED